MTPKQLLKFLADHKIEYVDCRFMDYPGIWQHATYPVEKINEQTFTKGIGFDGSCIRGWQAINEADMVLVPVAETAAVDPFFEHPTVGVTCDVKDPVTRKNYSRDPRSIARKAEEHLRASKVGDEARFSPEMEFFLFDNVSYDQTVNECAYRVDSVEGIWNRGKADPANLGYQVRQKEGYFPVPPMDTLADVRSEMVDVMRRMGLAVDSHHHEVATGGQCEIDLRHLPLLAMADACMLYKYVVRNVAARAGKVATFMPKPLFMDNGSGMHTHFSIWKQGKPLMGGRRYGGLSQLGLYAVGGILRHAQALSALTNPTTNSFKRLVPGYEAPVHLMYSSRNRAAAIRIPMYQDDPGTKRLEIRFPDCTANPYLAFAALTMAAIDGVRNKIDPGAPVDKNLVELAPEEYESIDGLPVDLPEALDALEADHDFLLQGGVFTQDVIHYWIKYKRENEVAAIRHRPHPYEFCMYFDM